MSTSIGDEPELDVEDIQGHVLPGFNRQVSLLIGLAIEDLGGLRAVARAVRPHVTSLLAALGHKIQRKEKWLGLRRDQPVQAPFLAVAFSAPGLALWPEGAELSALEASFEAGMAPSSTGDASAPVLEDGSPNPSARVNWRVGNEARRLDALLLLAGDTAPELDALYAEVGKGLRELGVRETYREQGQRLPGDTEHFGFRDGVSMPGVFGRVAGPRGLQPLTTRYGVPDGADGVQFGRPGQPLVWPAQFLFGTHASATQVAPAPALARNGSLLVFRRLAQDVAAFRRDTAAMAVSLSGGGDGVVGEDLVRAWVVGRWPNGESLVRSPTTPSGALGELELNHFAYQFPTPPVVSDGIRLPPVAADPDGSRCPLFAHVRKVNPRDRPTDQGPPSITRGLQMLRRGIAYGPAYDPVELERPSNGSERGLLFLAYQTSINNQFERLQTRWANQLNAPEASLGSTGPGHDALIGTNTTSARQPGPRLVQREARSATLLARWVTLTGGGYLFTPSLTLLRHLAE